LELGNINEEVKTEVCTTITNRLDEKT